MRIHLPNSLRILLKLLISLPLGFLLSPLILILLLLNSVARTFVSILLRFQYGSKLRLVPVSKAGSNVWHYKTPGNNRMITLLIKCQDPIDLETHRRNWTTRVINHKLPNGKLPFSILKTSFTRKYGYHCLRDYSDEFDIENHVSIYNYKIKDVDEKFSSISEEDFLEKVIPEMSKDIEDTEKPAWEEVVVPGVKFSDRDDPCWVRVLRLHHAYMDGGGIALLLGEAMVEGGLKNFPLVVDPVEDLKISKWQEITLMLYCMSMAVWSYYRVVSKEGSFRNRFLETPLGERQGQRFFRMSPKIEIDRLKRIKAQSNKSNCKVGINAIVASVFAEALDKTNHRFAPEARARNDDIVVGYVTAFPGYRFLRLENRVACSLFNVPHRYRNGNVKETYLKTLEAVQRKMGQVLLDPATLLHFYVGRVVGMFPQYFVDKVVESGVGYPITFTSLPIRKNTGNPFWGNSVSEVGAFPPMMTNAGLGILAVSDGLYMRFWTVTDEACISREEVEFFLSQTVVVVDEMEKELRAMAVTNEVIFEKESDQLLVEIVTK